MFSMFLVFTHIIDFAIATVFLKHMYNRIINAMNRKNDAGDVIRQCSCSLACLSIPEVRRTNSQSSFSSPRVSANGRMFKHACLYDPLHM